MEQRSYPIIKLHAAQRYLVWHYLQNITMNIRVCEFPKSGGTWLSQMLGDLFQLPYPRNSRLPIKRCIQHEHYPGPANSKTILVVRDGRDVVTSAYFHFLVSEDKRPPRLLKRWRNLMGEGDYNDVEKLLPKFINVFNKHYKVGGKKMSWSQHIRSFDLLSDQVLVVKYEDLLDDAQGQLGRISEWYQIKPNLPVDQIVRKYSFESQTKRKRGEEDKSSFLRKGISGDYKNYFNAEAETQFNLLHGEVLKNLGYV